MAKRPAEPGLFDDDDDTAKIAKRRSEEGVLGETRQLVEQLKVMRPRLQQRDAIMVNSAHLILGELLELFSNANKDDQVEMVKDGVAKIVRDCCGNAGPPASRTGQRLIDAMKDFWAENMPNESPRGSPRNPSSSPKANGHGSGSPSASTAPAKKPAELSKEAKEKAEAKSAAASKTRDAARNVLSRVIGDDKAKEVEEILYQKYNQPDDSTPKATPVIVFKQKDYKDHMLLIKNSLQRNESLLHKLRSGGLKSQELTEMDADALKTDEKKAELQETKKQNLHDARAADFSSNGTESTQYECPECGSFETLYWSLQRGWHNDQQGATITVRCKKCNHTWNTDTGN